MKKCQAINLVLITFALLGCGVHYTDHQATRTLKLRLPTAISNFDTSKTIALSIPKGGKVKRNVEGLLHASEVEHRVLYPNGAVLYVSNNYLDGSELNYSNRLQMGYLSYKRKFLFDTIIIKGQQRDSTFWQEILLGDITVGYVNVPEIMKASFDLSLNNLIIE